MSSPPSVKVSDAEISVSGLSKYFGSFCAVNNISFEVPRGAIVGFLGPNGAGKTTTIRMLTCYLPPTSGTATVAGFDVFRQSLQVRENLGYLPEHTPLYTEMRISEFLDYRARLRGMDREIRKKRIAEVAERCWLKERMRSLIGNLSKGYRQRVGIADALLHNPRVLVLDEPTVGLDPSQIREARKLIGDLAGDHTVLLSTHILQEVEMICQRVIIVARGTIVAQGTPEELKNRVGLGLLAEIRGPVELVKNALSALSGVQSIEVVHTSGMVHQYLLKGQLTSELREQVADLVSQRGWNLRELRSAGATLEEYFVRITDPALAGAA